MKAIVIEKFGGPDQLKLTQMTAPTPKDNEVQIQIEFAGVNPVDWKIREGLKNKLPYEFPIILGWDASGRISAIGKSVKNFKVGDPVYTYCRQPTIHWGTYAEYICCEEDMVARKPPKLTFGEAAASPLVSLTAWQVLFDVAKLKKGETILIQAGAGGVGSLAIQFAKNVGAIILTTASEDKHTYVKSLGAQTAIDYHKQNVAEAVKKLYPQGVDVVFDTVGGETLKESYPLLKPGGRIVSIVEPPKQELADPYKAKALYHFVTPNGQQLEQIGQLIQEGKVKPITIEEMPLEQAAQAQEKVQEGHLKGKIVLKIK